ncbi:MAG: hypothetical protein GQ569_04320 [Methylococcaceae bacterium]|nr:hypothetical protein [Methylococcaceae bacterium]
MNMELWEVIASINNALSPLRSKDSPSTITMNDLLELRSKLRTRLEHLRAVITEQYSERDAYYVLFPLTAHCDELVKKIILDRKQLEWPALQQELYQVVDAGDLFYELLDNALKKPETLPLVYEVYYFCLHDGFHGRYTGNPERLNDYIEKLRNHIHLPPLATTSSPPTTAKRRWANFRMRKHFYYSGSALILVLIYFFFVSLASTWQPIT